ncbi:hypothetical protein HELRODRAFT_174839 [Helobdella robusta]|uniref:EF-hand domain-containing protein n=1 Tax=Helobdella robusta TaxID=6412 RepID=T1F8I9_HELRO|nr:hypothetical protein HELRODRAFT_174839 [Helobdella robusta]ESO01289.1 hypothetical protein HELRODRAFT_174839 [Helobdella robusta]
MDKENLKAIFNDLGVASQGYVNKDELAKICEYFGMEDMTKKELDKLFQDLDQDKDGKISEDEFLVGMFNKPSPPTPSTPKFPPDSLQEPTAPVTSPAPNVTPRNKDNKTTPANKNNETTPTNKDINTTPTNKDDETTPTNKDANNTKSPSSTILPTKENEPLPPKTPSTKAVLDKNSPETDSKDSKFDSLPNFGDKNKFPNLSATSRADPTDWLNFLDPNRTGFVKGRDVIDYMSRCKIADGENILKRLNFDPVGNIAPSQLARVLEQQLKNSKDAALHDAAADMLLNSTDKLWSVDDDDDDDNGDTMPSKSDRDDFEKLKKKLEDSLKESMDECERLRVKNEELESEIKKLTEDLNNASTIKDTNYEATKKKLDDGDDESDNKVRLSNDRYSSLDFDDANISDDVRRTIQREMDRREKLAADERKQAEGALLLEISELESKHADELEKLKKDHKKEKDDLLASQQRAIADAIAEKERDLMKDYVKDKLSSSASQLPVSSADELDNKNKEITRLQNELEKQSKLIEDLQQQMKDDNNNNNVEEAKPTTTTTKKDSHSSIIPTELRKFFTSDDDLVDDVKDSIKEKDDVTNMVSSEGVDAMRANVVKKVDVTSQTNENDVIVEKIETGIQTEKVIISKAIDRNDFAGQTDDDDVIAIERSDIHCQTNHVVISDVIEKINLHTQTDEIEKVFSDSEVQTGEVQGDDTKFAHVETQTASNEVMHAKTQTSINDVTYVMTQTDDDLVAAAVEATTQTTSEELISTYIQTDTGVSRDTFTQTFEQSDDDDVEKFIDVTSQTESRDSVDVSSQTEQPRDSVAEVSAPTMATDLNDMSIQTDDELKESTAAQTSTVESVDVTTQCETTDEKNVDVMMQTEDVINASNDNISTQTSIVGVSEVETQTEDNVFGVPDVVDVSNNELESLRPSRASLTEEHDASNKTSIQTDVTDVIKVPVTASTTTTSTVTAQTQTSIIEGDVINNDTSPATSQQQQFRNIETTITATTSTQTDFELDGYDDNNDERGDHDNDDREKLLKQYQANISELKSKIAADEKHMSQVIHEMDLMISDLEDKLELSYKVNKKLEKVIKDRNEEITSLKESQRHRKDGDENVLSSRQLRQPHQNQPQLQPQQPQLQPQQLQPQQPQLQPQQPQPQQPQPQQPQLQSQLQPQQPQLQLQQLQPQQPQLQPQLQPQPAPSQSRSQPVNSDLSDFDNVINNIPDESIENLIKDYESKLNDVRLEFEKERSKIKQDHDKEIKKLADDFATAIDSLNKDRERKLKEMENKENPKTINKIKDLESRISDLMMTNERIILNLTKDNEIKKLEIKNLNALAEKLKNESKMEKNDFKNALRRLKNDLRVEKEVKLSSAGSGRLETYLREQISDLCRQNAELMSRNEKVDKADVMAERDLLRDQLRRTLNQLNDVTTALTALTNQHRAEKQAWTLAKDQLIDPAKYQQLASKMAWTEAANEKLQAMLERSQLESTNLLTAARESFDKSLNDLNKEKLLSDNYVNKLTGLIDNKDQRIKQFVSQLCSYFIFISMNDQQKKTEKLIKDLYSENARLVKYLQVLEKQKNDLNSTNKLLEDKCLALGDLVRRLCPAAVQ